MSNSIAELAGARLILAVGTNTTETHPVLSIRVKEAVSHGAKLIVVDPRRIELTRYATRWLPLAVGSDTALFNAMAHVILAEGLEDRSFVERHTAGVEELRAFVADYAPERVAAITGLPADQIVAAAREYATTKPAAIIYTLGVTEHTCGTHNVQSLANLAVLCGQVGIPNAGINPLRGQNNVQGAGDVGCLPTDYPGYQKVGLSEVRARWEALWGVALPQRPGITKVRAVDEILAGRVRAAYIMGENTVVSDAHAAKTRRALEAVDFLVVQDIFLTETARLADVVLPGASFAETDGTFINTERRVQRVRKAVEPPGQARADWRILAELATRLGYAMPYDHPSEIWAELAAATPIFAGISYDRLDQGGIQWPCPSPDHPGTPYLHAELWEGRQTAYFQLVPHTPPAEQPDADYPFVLTTGRRRPAYHTQTQTGRSQALRRLLPQEAVEIHPRDAASLGVSEGDLVRIRSRRGEVTAPAHLTDRSPEGVVFLSFHFPEQVLTNLLTNDAHDPITETPEFKACAVRLERA
jgi:formate dehydrogenase major subunit/formate dehydrogenase alpha subunit